MFPISHSCPSCLIFLSLTLSIRYGFEGELYVPHGLFVWSIEHFMKFLATHRFNAVRLPFSLEWIARGLDAPLLNIYVVQEDMRELTQGQVLERIFDAAAAEGIMILLDLHVIQVKEGIKDLWYDKTASPERVIDLWTTMLERFAGRWNLLVSGKGGQGKEGALTSLVSHALTLRSLPSRREST